MSKKMFLIVLFLLMAFMGACKDETVPPPSANPGEMETQVAEEVAVQLTEIALSQPTTTQPSVPVVPATDLPAPTNTLLPPTESLPTLDPASLTASPTPTNNAPTVTQTTRPTSTATPAPFACQILKQVPENGKTFKPDDDFDAIWTLKNVGTSDWDENEVDYKYESGDKFYQNEIYDLPETVKPGESIDIIVDMKAPDDEGDYDTTWVLRRGSHLICTLKVEISVEK